MTNKNLEDACMALSKALADVLTALSEANRPEPASATRLYTYDNLAEMFGKSKSTVRQWVCAGEFGEPVKVGNSIRVTQAGVDKFIADHSGPTKKMPSRARPKKVRAATSPQGLPLGI